MPHPQPLKGCVIKVPMTKKALKLNRTNQFDTQSLKLNKADKKALSKDDYNKYAKSSVVEEAKAAGTSNIEVQTKAVGELLARKLSPFKLTWPDGETHHVELVCAVSDSAYHLRFMWRHPQEAPGSGGPVGVCDNLRVDRRDMIGTRYVRVRGELPPPFQRADREILEGGQLAAQAAGFRWRRLESDVTDALGLPPPDRQVYS